MPVYRVDHETVYEYTLPVVISQHLAHMQPREVPRQKWLEHFIEIDPEPTARQERTDFFGNRALAFSIEREHTRFRFFASGTVEVGSEPVPEVSPAWETVAETALHPETPAEFEAAKYAYTSPLAVWDESVRNYAAESFRPRRSLLEGAGELMTRIHEDCIYAPGSTRIGALPPEILRERRGVCQDFAHLMIGCMRSLRLPCRYVSGYLLTHPPAGQPKLIGADATHAWVAVFVPGYGWVEFDPTNNVSGTEEHIIIGWGRDFGDVSPLKGVITGGGPHTLKVAVNVEKTEG
mgnify:CR=1 FL=1